MRNGTTNQIRCVMLRHGQTLSNERKLYLGQREEELSEAGFAGLLEKKQAGYYPQVSVWITSPMVRCRQTASYICPNREIRVIEAFKEIDFGKWEQKSYLDLAGDEEYQRWIDSNGEAQIPGGECKRDFIARVMKGWEEFLKMARTDSAVRNVDCLGFVLHGGTIMALLSSLCGGDYYDYQVKNTEGYEFLLDMASGELTDLRKRMSDICDA